MTTEAEPVAPSEDPRRRNMWPLPGGVDAYAESARLILESVDGEQGRGDLEQTIFDLFPQVRSTSTVRGYAGVLITLGFLERSAAGRVRVTAAGSRFARTNDLKLLREALVDRVYGVRELLETLAEGETTYMEITRKLQDRGISWENVMALRYRIWWLRAAGALRAERRMRADWLRITPPGRALLRR